MRKHSHWQHHRSKNIYGEREREWRSGTLRLRNCLFNGMIQRAHKKSKLTAGKIYTRETREKKSSNAHIKLFLLLSSNLMIFALKSRILENQTMGDNTQRMRLIQCRTNTQYTIHTKWFSIRCFFCYFSIFLLCLVFFVTSAAVWGL